MNLRPAIILGAAFTVSTAILVHTAGRVIPNADGLVDVDYGYFVPYLLAGARWFHQNGWSAIPDFTPDFCGGIPWLANPQSIIYSLPQVLTLYLADPVAAVRWSLFFFATFGAAATYYLLRRGFGLSWQASGLGFVLFQLNGFLIFRTTIGHLTYLIFGLVPFLCVCVLVVPRSNARSMRLGLSSNDIVAALVAAGAIAVMVYGGGLNYIIPAVLGVSAIVLIEQARTGPQWRPWVVLGAACIWASFLSALKIVPAFVLASDYPRHLLADHLFASPIQFAVSLFRSLFIPEYQPYLTQLPKVQLGQHELEFGVSVVPLCLMAAALVYVWRSRGWHGYLGPYIGLAVIVAIPVAGTIGNEFWGGVLMRIPIINNNTALIRWWSIYIPAIVVAAALSFDKIFAANRARDIGLTLCVFVAAFQLGIRDVSFYTAGVRWGLYDPAFVGTTVGRELQEAAAVPDIKGIGAGQSHGTGWLDRNDGLLQGLSSVPCYEPLFGYGLEMFPARGLKVGPLDDQADGFLNMADPRCYLSSGAQSCRPGDRFRVADREAMLLFASHRPLPWHVPVWRRAASLTTFVSAGLSIVLLLGWSSVQLWRCRRVVQ